MSNINIRSKLISALGATGVLLGANAAFAYSVGTEALDGDSWGNSRFSASYTYQSSEASEGTVTTDRVSRASSASQLFEVKTKLFGKASTPVSWSAVGAGMVQRSGTNPAKYTDTVLVTAILHDDALITIGLRDQPCPDHDETWSCLTYEKALSKTLFKKSADFSLAGIPIGVDGSLAATLNMSAGAWGRAMPFVAAADSLRATGLAQLSAGAFLEGRLKAFAGIDDVLAVGVTAKLRFIDIDVTTKSLSKQDGLGAGARIAHTNMMPLTVKSMGGKVTLWADITPFWTEEMTLINWKGYTWTGNIIGFENLAEQV